MFEGNVYRGDDLVMMFPDLKLFQVLTPVLGVPSSGVFRSVTCTPHRNFLTHPSAAIFAPLPGAMLISVNLQ